jgi:hypothetical protein
MKKDHLKDIGAFCSPLMSTGVTARKTPDISNSTNP